MKKDWFLRIKAILLTETWISLMIVDYLLSKVFIKPLWATYYFRFSMVFFYVYSVCAKS